MDVIIVLNVVSNSKSRRDLERVRPNLFYHITVDIVSGNLNGFPMHLRFCDLLTYLVEVLFHKISVLTARHRLPFLYFQEVIKVL